MLKYLVCFLAITSTLGQVTFSTPKTSTSFTPTYVTMTNGILVTTSAAGWVTTDPLTALNAGAGTVTVYTTLQSNTASNVGIGVTSYPTTGTAAANTCDTATLSGYASLAGKAAATTCKSDFVTVYAAAPGTAPATSNTDTGLIGAGGVQTLTGTAGSVKWVLTTSATMDTAKCYKVDVYPPNGQNDVSGTQKTANAANVCQGTGSGAAAVGSPTAGGFFAQSASYQYAFYIEQFGTGAATVCIQTDAQWTANKGNCGLTMVTAATTKDVTWASPTIYQANSAAVGTVKQYTQGYVVSLTTPGYIISDPMTNLWSTEKTGFTIYATVTAATANVAVGMTAVGSASSTKCTTSAFTTQHPAATASLLGLSSGNCPSDFITAYTVAPGANSYSKAKATLITTTAGTNTAKWVIVSPEVSTKIKSDNYCDGIIYYAPGALTTATEYNGQGVCGTASNTNPTGYAVTSNLYGFYAELEAAGTGTVCFQTQAQYTASAGNCGTAVTSSGSGSGSGSSTSSATLLSAIMAPFILVILAFFN